MDGLGGDAGQVTSPPTDVLGDRMGPKQDQGQYLICNPERGRKKGPD